MALSSGDEAMGFVQLYPSFSSVAMKRMWYLNDLFVSADFRHKGVARKLLKEVKQYALETQSFTAKLATSIDNKEATSLYLSQGYNKVIAFDH